MDEGFFLGQLLLIFFSYRQLIRRVEAVSLLVPGWFDDVGLFPIS